MIILELAESFKTMNGPDPTWQWRYLTAYFSVSIEDRDVKFWHNLNLGLRFVL